MGRGFRWAGLVLLFAFVLPTFGADEKKDPKKPDPKKGTGTSDGDAKKDSAKKDDADKLIQVGTYIECKLLEIKNGQKIRVLTKRRVFNGRQYEIKDFNLEYEL